MIWRSFSLQLLWRWSRRRKGREGGRVDARKDVTKWLDGKAGRGGKDVRLMVMLFRSSVGRDGCGAAYCR